MKFSVCLDSFGWGDNPEGGFRIIRKAGMSHYEFWSWWDKDVEQLAEFQRKYGISPAAFCTRYFSLSDRSRHPLYLEGLRESIAVARKLGCGMLITQVGDQLPDVPRERQVEAVIQGLSACVPLLEESGITLLFEPLNTKRDHGGYLLSGSGEADAIAQAVGSPWVKVLFDFYHQQIMEGDVIQNSIGMLDRIGHFHCAGNPGRHELDTGELSYEGIFRALEQAGYKGYIGLEYVPTRDVCGELTRLQTRFGG